MQQMVLLLPPPLSACISWGQASSCLPSVSRQHLAGVLEAGSLREGRLWMRSADLDAVRGIDFHTLSSDMELYSKATGTRYQS